MKQAWPSLGSLPSTKKLSRIALNIPKTKKIIIPSNSYYCQRLGPNLDELAGFLESLPRAIHNNHVFLFKGKPVRDIRTALKDGCKKAGIPYGQKEKNGFVFHDLRHSFNIHMRKAGVPESVIMKMTGHSTRQMFDRYNTVDMEDARQAVDQLRGYFENVDQMLTKNQKT